MASEEGATWKKAPHVGDRRSASRGLMATRGLYVFEHESMLGNAPAHELFERIDVPPLGADKAPRRFSITRSRSMTRTCRRASPCTVLSDGVRSVRGVHLRSVRLGLTGKADVVEFHPLTPGPSPRGEGRGGRPLFPRRGERGAVSSATIAAGATVTPVSWLRLAAGAAWGVNQWFGGLTG